MPFLSSLFSSLVLLKERRKQKRINDEIDLQIAIEKKKRRREIKILLMGFLSGFIFL